jgi:hypothetical protein
MADLAFAERARREAARYGGGPWVFVRELLQNARDARARRVRFASRLEGGELVVACRDDGDGMTFEHARRYLFRLYASSKDGRRGQAGRFGVGFWSLLAFEPSGIVVRSWPRRGEPWEVELDGSLQGLAQRRPAHEGHGTEVRLRRRCEPPDDSREQLQAAVAAFGRFLTRVDAPARPLEVRVEGRAVGQAFDLPAPRLRFGDSGLRGVVALAAQPRVELLVRGLPVREAACLQDLLAAEERRAGRAPRPQLGGGLAPAALLDSAAVEVLLSRDDVRAGRALAGLVERAERELDRLIERQLECLRPPSWSERLRAAARSPATSVALAALLAVATAEGARRLLHQDAPPPPLAAPSAAATAGTAPRAAAAGSLAPYRDLGESYQGAWSDEALAGRGRSVALRYEPPRRQPRLAALVVPEPGLEAGAAVVAGPYRGPGCAGGCLAFELLAESRSAVTRLPVPSGEAVDPGSVLVDGGPVRVLASPLGEPLLVLPAGLHRVRYQTGPAPWDAPGLPPPAPLAATTTTAARLRQLPAGARATATLGFVRAHVRYSTEATVARAHRERALLPFAQRALEVGAGDCDVQNGLLAELLRAAGLPARLVVGYLGAEGRARPFLHAWVEHRAEDGSVAVLDASAVGSASAADPGESAAGPASEATSPDSGPSAAALRPADGAGEERPVHAARRGLATLAWTGAVLAGLAALAGLGRRWRRGRRDVALDRQGSLAELLRGVLENPRAFDHLPALLRRELVPALGRKRLALGPAWRAALRGQLFVSRARPALARRAAKAGLMVLDGARDEGRVVAEALGAIDLDEWETRLAAARAGPLAPLNQHLRARAERWRALLLDGLGAPRLLVLPGARVLPAERAERLLLLDAADPWLAELVALQAARPARALLASLARLAPLAGLPPDEQLELLAPSAAAALEERAP